jgi:hypothetical protein
MAVTTEPSLAFSSLKQAAGRERDLAAVRQLLAIMEKKAPPGSWF